MIIKPVVYNGRELVVFQETTVFDYFFAPVLNITPDDPRELEILQRYARLMSQPRQVWAADRLGFVNSVE